MEQYFLIWENQVTRFLDKRFGKDIDLKKDLFFLGSKLFFMLFSKSLNNVEYLNSNKES